MTRTYRQRAIFTVAVTTLCLALGVAGGYLLGCAVVLRATANGMEQTALQVEGRVRSYISESYRLLRAMNDPTRSLCTDQELTELRLWTFKSEFIRDIGHTRDGRIVCSAMMGRIKEPMVLPPALRDELISGLNFHHGRHFPPMAESAWDNHGIVLGNSYVVLSNNIFAVDKTPSLYFVRNAFQVNRKELQEIWGVAPDIDLKRLNGNKTFIENGSLYVTRCSVERPSCTTAFLSILVALQRQLSLQWICTGTGAVVGLLLGIFCSIIFRRSLSMRHQLRRALKNGDVQVVYQPIVEVSSRRIVEAEALARWTDEDGFAVSPEIFVQTAVEGGFMGDLTAQVVQRSLEGLKAMLRIDPDFRVNINVTATDLSDEHFMPMLASALQEAGIAARHLAIEVTESATVRAGSARQTIQQLRERGHSVQIDDFGTGYSSLSYLDELSVDAIKIDRAFTQAIRTKAVTASILPQVLAMANSLQLKVIAEGIETAEQADYFAGVEQTIYGQGWLFGRPMNAEDLCLLLAAQARALVG